LFITYCIQNNNFFWDLSQNTFNAVHLKSFIIYVIRPLQITFSILFKFRINFRNYESCR
jgi:hypothetical protein